MMRKKALVLLLLVGSLLKAKGLSLPDGPEVGQVAPPLKLSTWLQAPPEAAQGWPTGKVVVLEFWGIHCGPCVAAIPHLNELADQFKNKPVQFIAIAVDEVIEIQRFLKKTPIHAWIGLGPSTEYLENSPYRILAVPHTVMIDTHGQIALITDPDGLDAETIQECLDGKLRAPNDEQIFATDKTPSAIKFFHSDGGTIPGVIPGQYRMGIKPLFQVMILSQPTNSTPRSEPVESWNPHAMTLQNVSLNKAIERAFDAKQTRIVTETELPVEKHDFYISVPPDISRPKNRDALEGAFAQGVAATFGLTVRRERREVDLLVLKANATTLGSLSQSTNPRGEYQVEPGEASATDKPMAALAGLLESITRKPVLDETGLTNRYSYDIKWEQKDARPNVAGVTEAVKKLGLDLVQVKKSLEVIVISKMRKTSIGSEYNNERTF